MIKIILCTYNGERYIEEQILSIMKQSGISKDAYRLLVSDDCSADNTIDIIKKMQEKFPDRIELRLRKTPTGSAAKHFLTVLHDSVKRKDISEYYMFCDQDDIWDKDKVMLSLQEIKIMEVRYGKYIPLLAFCDAKVVDSCNKVLAQSFVKYQKLSPGRVRFNNLLLQNCVTGASMIINSTLAESVNTVPEHAYMHDMWIALIAADRGAIRYIDRSLYRYRQHGGNVLGANKGSIISESFKRIMQAVRGDIKTKVAYEALFTQAEEFNKINESILSEKDKFIIDKFISLRKKGKIGKIYTILRYGFTYNELYRTIGECIFI